MTHRFPLTKMRYLIALLIRKILSNIVAPLTGFLQRLDLSVQSTHQAGYTYFIIHRLARLLSWLCQGGITLAYPCMGYNPIKSRQQETSRQWASEILHQPPYALEAEAKKFLLHTQQLLPSEHLLTTPSFTVLICFHHHLQFFKSCIDSVNAACRHSPTTHVEILIVNDDPSIDSKQLFQEMDRSLEEKIIFHANKNNLGICQSTNEAIARARGEWILHLDCDDRLEPNVFSILTQAIKKNPTVRFISSRAIDIDEQGNILSWRLRSEKSSDLIINNFANHLKIIKKNLHADIGIFNSTFEGCQDYEFALRTVINEPLLFIPDYLYQYRWHDQSQTVSHNKRQNLTSARIRQTYLLAIHWMTHSTKMIQWNISGPFAEEWKQSLVQSDASTFAYHVSLEATHPFNETQRRLLLVHIATIAVDRHREKNSDREITARV